MKRALKSYLPSIVIGILLLLSAPLLSFVIFLAGDSCCGEDTSGNMLLVTAIISLGMLGASFFGNLFYKLIFKKTNSWVWVGIATIITWIISSTWYWLFVSSIIATAF